MDTIMTMQHRGVDDKHPTNTLDVNVMVWEPSEPGQYTMDFTCHATPTDTQKDGNTRPRTTVQSTSKTPDALEIIRIPIQAKDDDEAVYLATKTVKQIFTDFLEELKAARAKLMGSDIWRDTERLQEKLQELGDTHKTWVITDHTFVQPWHWDGRHFLGIRQLSVYLTHEPVPLKFTTIVRAGDFNLFEIMDCLMLSIKRFLDDETIKLFANGQDEDQDYLELLESCIVT